MNYTYAQFRHGQRCICKINHAEVRDAKISISSSGTVYICQNVQQGSIAPDRLGYSTSWQVLNRGEDYANGKESVYDLVLLSPFTMKTSKFGVTNLGITEYFEKRKEAYEYLKSLKDPEAFYFKLEEKKHYEKPFTFTLKRKEKE